jgi:hypothetical protein
VMDKRQHRAEWARHLVALNAQPLSIMLAPRITQERVAVVRIIEALDRLIAIERKSRGRLNISEAERERRREWGRELHRRGLATGMYRPEPTP